VRLTWIPQLFLSSRTGQQSASTVHGAYSNQLAVTEVPVAVSDAITVQAGQGAVNSAVTHAAVGFAAKNF